MKSKLTSDGNLYLGLSRLFETIYQLDKANECMKHIQLENQHPNNSSELILFLVTKLQSQKRSGLSRMKSHIFLTSNSLEPSADGNCNPSSSDNTISLRDSTDASKNWNPINGYVMRIKEFPI